MNLFIRLGMACTCKATDPSRYTPATRPFPHSTSIDTYIIHSEPVVRDPDTVKHSGDQSSQVEKGGHCERAFVGQLNKPSGRAK